MSVGITGKRKYGYKTVAMYDTVTGWAFGPTFSSKGDALLFIRFAESQPGIKDVRAVPNQQLQKLHSEWIEAGKP